MKVKLPGRELGPDEPFQFVEEEVMQVSDYDVIIDKGWNAWNFEFMKEIQSPPWHGRIGTVKVLWNFIKDRHEHRQEHQALEGSRGMPVMFHAGVAPPFDVFSLSRSLRPFYRDIFENAGEGQEGRRSGHRGHDQAGHQPTPSEPRATGWPSSPCARAPSFISPKIFDEISFPSLKRMVEGITRRASSRSFTATATGT